MLSHEVRDREPTSGTHTKLFMTWRYLCTNTVLLTSLSSLSARIPARVKAGAPAPQGMLGPSQSAGDGRPYPAFLALLLLFPLHSCSALAPPATSWSVCANYSELLATPSMWICLHISLSLSMPLSAWNILFADFYLEIASSFSMTQPQCLFTRQIFLKAFGHN